MQIERRIGEILRRRWEQNEVGQALAEYGLILALVAIACAAALDRLGDVIPRVLFKVAEQL